MKEGVWVQVVEQVDELLEYYMQLQSLAKERGGWDRIAAADASKFIAGGMAAIRRIAGRDSEFEIPAAKALESYHSEFLGKAIPHVAGGLTAVGEAVVSGHLVTLQELVHAEVFADFLEMAEHLLEGGYTDPAAVLVGGVLEGHLRNLCAKNNMPTEFVDRRGRSRRKKVETMNAELAKAGVYSKADQKNVTGWYGIRLDPAHGDYGKHTNEEVKVMLLGVREFVTRHAA